MFYTKDQVLNYLQKEGDKYDFTLEANTIPKKFIHDREIVLAGVAADGRFLRYLPDIMRSDQEIVLKAIADNDEAYTFASEELKAQEDFQLLAIEANVETLRYMPEEITSNREFIYKLVQKRRRGHLIQHAPKELHLDREIALAAVQSDATAFDRFMDIAREKWSADREFILDAVASNGQVLAYASESLQDDREVVVTAIQTKNPSLAIIVHASEVLQNDPEIQRIALTGHKEHYLRLQREGSRDSHEALSHYYSLLRQTLDYFKVPLEYYDEGKIISRSLLLTALRTASEFEFFEYKHSDSIFTHLPEELQSDREIVLALVQLDGKLNLDLRLKGASEAFRNDREIVLTAVQKNGHALEYASEG